MKINLNFKFVLSTVVVFLAVVAFLNLGVGESNAVLTDPPCPTATGTFVCGIPFGCAGNSLGRCTLNPCGDTCAAYKDDFGHQFYDPATCTSGSPVCE